MSLTMEELLRCEVATLKAELEAVKRELEEEKNNHQHTLEGAWQFEKDWVQMKRERDAAVSELPHNCWNCKNHMDKPIEETDDYGRTVHRYCEADYCFPEEENSCWEWRGVQENGGAE